MRCIRQCPPRQNKTSQPIAEEAAIAVTKRSNIWYFPATDGLL